MTKESQQHNTVENSEVSLKELVLKIQYWCKYLLSKWLIIIASGLLGGALGLVYATTKKPVYTATTTFVLEDEKGGGSLGGLAGLASIAGVEIGGGGGIFEGDNILELYKSRKMIVKTLLSKVSIHGKNEMLIDRYIYVNGLKKTWLEKPDLLKLKFSAHSMDSGTPDFKSNRLRDSLLTNIVENITKNYLVVAKPDKKLSIIKVDVSAKDEIFAKSFNDALVKNVNDFFVQTKTKKSLQNIQILEQKRDSVRSVMNGAIYSAIAVADATPNLNLTRQVQRVAPAQRAQFSAETNKAILGSLVQNLEMSKLSLMKETPLLEVIDQPVYPLQKEKFSKFKGLILGFLVGCCLVVSFLIVRRFLKELIS